MIILNRRHNREHKDIGYSFPMSKIAMSFNLLTIVLFAFISIGCSKEEVGETDDDILLVMDGKELTMQYVIERIPVGLDPADSIALFHKIVDGWIETEVLSELAATKLPDLEEIDKKVEAYRNRLIISEYLRKMKESKRQKVSQDDVKKYYEAHRKELLTETPLVKGVYIKVPSNSPGLQEIKDLIFRAGELDIDKIEKGWMETALQYDYFGSNWVDWQTLADQIPYRFYDPDAFLKSTKNFETSYNGSTYMFHIYDYLPRGSEFPYEFASDKITSMLEQLKIADFEEALVRSLVEKSLKEEKLIAVGYDPLKRQTLRRKEMKNKDTK